VLVVTEAVFSMDGDVAPLAEIVALSKRHGAWVMVDEAHSAGVFGGGGAGLVDEMGLASEVDVHVGTLGKALGSFGAYVAGSRDLMDLLINRARSFIFTTGLPPSAAAAASAAISICRREPERAAGLRRRVAALSRQLRESGLDVPEAQSQILPVPVGDSGRAVAAMHALLEAGVYVAAIRPPTVPEGTSRLRLSLMATHDDEQLARAADALVAAVRSSSG
jgi:7-keto-8-aminopelargonate synthetase-like enzyme